VGRIAEKELGWEPDHAGNSVLSFSVVVEAARQLSIAHGCVNAKSCRRWDESRAPIPLIFRGVSLLALGWSPAVPHTLLNSGSLTGVTNRDEEAPSCNNNGRPPSLGTGRLFTETPDRSERDELFVSEPATGRCARGGAWRHCPAPGARRPPEGGSSRAPDPCSPPRGGGCGRTDAGRAPPRSP
jgi:hypothetical protein